MSYKNIRKIMEKIFGKICMIESAGIRYIPKSERKKIKGYRTSDDTITYHHITERKYGGKDTINNGALIKGYNHVWLHSLPEEEKNKVNQDIIEFKASIITIYGNQITINNKKSIFIDPKYLEDSEDIITIPTYPTDDSIQKKRKKFNRAKVKSDTDSIIQDGINDYLSSKEK